MIIQKAYRTRIDPTSAQESLFRLQSDVVRYCYNRFLDARCRHYHDTGKMLGTSDLIKGFRARRPEWTRGASSRAEETAARNLDAAYKSFFERRTKFPKFKKRGKDAPSFTYWSIKPEHIQSNKIRLQGIGWIKLCERDYIPLDVKVNSVTVSQKGGKWWVSVQCEEEVQEHIPSGHAIGVDVGISALAVTSDGTRYENPRSTKAHERKLARLNRKMARQEKGSGRREVTKAKLARLHAHIGNVRRWHTHQASSDIVGRSLVDEERPIIIGVEDLGVSGMVRNRHLSKSISDANMSEMLRQIAYKSEWQSTQVHEWSRRHPSSQTCSRCGAVRKRKLTLRDRVFECPSCGFVMDRDENAARNLIPR